MSLPASAALLVPAVVGAGAALSRWLSEEEEEETAPAPAADAGDSNRGLALGAAAVVSVAAVGVGYAAVHPAETRFAGLSQRLEYTLGVEALVALPLGLQMLQLARSRARARQGLKKERARTLAAEEVALAADVDEGARLTMLALPAHLALAGSLGADHMNLVPVAASLFLTGRVLAAGAGRGRGSGETRAFAWGLAFFPTALALAGCAVHSFIEHK